MTAAVDRWVERLAFWTAMAGGAVLVTVMLLTVVSVTGRSLIPLGLGPVPGDFELVETGTAFAVFAFLPWAHVRRGHITVDLFLKSAGTRVNAVVDVVANVLMTAAASVVAWRLWEGLEDKLAYGETTYILRFPLWWAYAASMFGAAVFVVVCAWSVWRSLREVRSGRTILAPAAGP